MAKRITRQQPREIVTWQQGEKRVVRAGGESRGEVAGMTIGYFQTAHEAEQACNQVVFDALTKKAA